MVDTKLFAELNKIETALIEKQSVVDALAWCGENRGTLKKIKVRLQSTPVITCTALQAEPYRHRCSAPKDTG